MMVTIRGTKCTGGAARTLARDIYIERRAHFSLACFTLLVKQCKMRFYKFTSWSTPKQYSKQ
jgi:hypothetical protein